MQNFYYNDNWRRGVSLTLKILCAPLYLRVHTNHPGTNVCTTLLVLFFYIFYSLFISSPLSNSLFYFSNFLFHSLILSYFFSLPLIVIFIFYTFFPLLDILRFLLVCIFPFFVYLFIIPSAPSLSASFSFLRGHLNPCIICWLYPDLLLVIS